MKVYFVLNTLEVASVSCVLLKQGRDGAARAGAEEGLGAQWGPAQGRLTQV